MKNLLIIGANGLLGSTLARIAKETSTWNPIALDIDQIDITNPASIASTLDLHHPNAIINCAAFTNVEACEEEDGFKTATRVNGEAVGFLASACKENAVPFIHISTDYVFNGSDREGISEETIPSEPMNAYGKTKRIGEENIIKIYGGLNGADFADQTSPAYLIRISWLFGHGAKNFVGKILELAQARASLSIVDDEIGTPTLADDLSERLLWLLDSGLPFGIYHATGKGSCSRYEFAEAIFNAKKHPIKLERAKLADFPRKAHIAPISILKNTRMPDMPLWQEMVARYIQEVE